MDTAEFLICSLFISLGISVEKRRILGSRGSATLSDYAIKFFSPSYFSSDEGISGILNEILNERIGYYLCDDKDLANHNICNVEKADCSPCFTTGFVLSFVLNSMLTLFIKTFSRICAQCPADSLFE